MITSKKLSPERIEEIVNFPIVYDEDSPKLTADQIASMKPAHPEYWGDEDPKPQQQRSRPVKAPETLR
jgi:hypothetical protein